MPRCPITYQQLSPGEVDYSANGLKRLSPRLRSLRRLPFSSSELVQEAARRAAKMSIGGVQPKLSAKLSLVNEEFRIVDTGGTFILKPENPNYKMVPENEDLTMKLAGIAAIEVPLHGMIFTSNGDPCYFIKRFDRHSKIGKLPLEDFGQLSGLTRDTKYNFSLEKVVKVIRSYCSFPLPELVKLFRRVVFSFLVGNEDMHVKNFSLLTDKTGLVKLSPGYDLLNTSILIDYLEESALPLAGKKSDLSRKEFVQYFAYERLELSESSVEEVLLGLEGSFESWNQTIDQSFLSKDLKQNYLKLVIRRAERLHLNTRPFEVGQLGL